MGRAVVVCISPIQPSPPPSHLALFTSMFLEYLTSVFISCTRDWSGEMTPLPELYSRNYFATRSIVMCQRCGTHSYGFVLGVDFLQFWILNEEFLVSHQAYLQPLPFDNILWSTSLKVQHIYFICSSAPLQSLRSLEGEEIMFSWSTVLLSDSSESN